MIDRIFGFGFCIGRHWGFWWNFGSGRKRGFGWPESKPKLRQRIVTYLNGFWQAWTSFWWIQLNFKQTLGLVFAKTYISAGFLNYAKKSWTQAHSVILIWAKYSRYFRSFRTFRSLSVYFRFRWLHFGLGFGLAKSIKWGFGRLLQSLIFLKVPLVVIPTIPHRLWTPICYIKDVLQSWNSLLQCL